jgi:hypothetical protein
LLRVDLRELQDWFGPGELDGCPRCLETAALTIEEADALLCFHCGYIRSRDTETSITELQPPRRRAEGALAGGGASSRRRR